MMLANDEQANLLSPSFRPALRDLLAVEYMAGGVTTMPPGHQTGWRTLPELVCSQVSGRHRVRMPDGDLWLTEGDAVFIPPGIQHNSEQMENGTSISRWSHLGLSLYGSLSIFPPDSPARSLRGEQAARIGGLNEELADLACREPQEPSDQVRFIGLTWLLASECLSAYALSDFALTTLRETWPIRAVLDCIERRLSEPLTRDDLAAVACLSPSRFAEVFRRAVGVAPHRYVLRRRMERAQRLLIYSPLSVGAVAGAVGFTDMFHFSRLFKRQFGVSPTDYRRTKGSLTAG